MDRTKRATSLAMAAGFGLAACSAPGGAPGATDITSSLAGDIRIDGSSTVFPVSEAIAEEFQAVHPGVRVTVAFSGTGGGFKKFCAGETDANDASRPIKDEEAVGCAGAGVTPVELAVATDGLSVVVSPENDWIDCLTVDELKRIWDQGSTVERWSDVRAGWPAEEIALFGPGADSGTFDYFTEEINGEAKRSRSDYTQSEDDNALVQGIAGDRNALGYFGYAYFVENEDKVKAVPIDGGSGCVAPTEATINEGTYTPLSRPLFIYPSAESLARPEVKAFFDFYLETVGDIVGEVGYVPLHDAALEASKQALMDAGG